MKFRISLITLTSGIWEKVFYDPQIKSDYDVTEFVKYIQLMQCTGGTPDRDLFKDPYDTSTFTDYDFEPLIKNCRGIIRLGAKPHLKLGGVPIKFTSDFVIGEIIQRTYSHPMIMSSIIHISRRLHRHLLMNSELMKSEAGASVV